MNNSKSKRPRSHEIKKNQRSLHMQSETRSLLSSFRRRMILDFEVETEDFALLCLIASANGLDQWPEGASEGESEVPFLTFH